MGFCQTRLGSGEARVMAGLGRLEHEVRSEQSKTKEVLIFTFPTSDVVPESFRKFQR